MGSDWGEPIKPVPLAARNRHRVVVRRLMNQRLFQAPDVRTLFRGIRWIVRRLPGAPRARVSLHCIGSRSGRRSCQAWVCGSVGKPRFLVCQGLVVLT